MSERLALIKKRLGESNDVVIREFNTSRDRVKLALLFIDGLVDKKLINDNIIQPILSGTIAHDYAEKITADNAFELIKKHVATASELSQVSNLTQAIKMVLSGDTALFIDGEQRILIFGTRMREKRSVDEPVTEAAVRGPREGFTETMRINTSLQRKRNKNKNIHI